MLLAATHHRRYEVLVHLKMNPLVDLLLAGVIWSPTRTISLGHTWVICYASVGSMGSYCIAIMTSQVSIFV